jgi:hypothetical protein
VYWLKRPPYFRWAAAAALVIMAMALELRQTPTVEHPFAATDLQRGDTVTSSSLEWREIPGGVLPPPMLDAENVLAVDLGEGEPLLSSQFAAGRLIPADWWSVPVGLPVGVPAGVLVQLVDTATGTAVDGIVTAPPSDDPFAVEPAGLVAVPADAAAGIATADAAGSLIVLVQSS